MANSEEDEANKNEVSQTNTSFLLKMEEVEESGNGSGNEIKIRLPSDDELKEADVRRYTKHGRTQFLDDFPWKIAVVRIEKIFNRKIGRAHV